MTFLASYARHVQNKLGCYDKQFGEHSLEQRILEGIESDDVQEQRTFLIDVDVVRGSVFAKNKPRHGWTQAVVRGLLRSLFAPFYWNYWSAHMSFRWAVYVMIHFALQFTQVFCFLLINPCTTRGSQDDVIVPFLLALGLGILHYHITSAHGGFVQTPATLTSSGDTERRSSGHSESLDTVTKFHHRASTELTEHFTRHRARYGGLESTQKVFHAKETLKCKPVAVSSLVESNRCHAERPVATSLKSGSLLRKQYLPGEDAIYAPSPFTEHRVKQTSPSPDAKCDINNYVHLSNLCNRTAANATDLDIIRSGQKLSDGSMMNYPSRHTYVKPGKDGQSSDEKHTGATHIVKPYLSGSTSPLRHLWKDPTSREVLNRAYTVHFPISDLEIGHRPSIMDKAGIRKAKPSCISCSSLCTPEISPRRNGLDSRWPRGTNPADQYSDPTLSSRTSTSSGESDLAKPTTHHTQGGPANIPIPVLSPETLMRTKPKPAVSKSSVSLTEGFSRVPTTCEGEVLSLPTESIRTDPAIDFSVDPIRHDLNHNEATYPETEDSGIAFNGGGSHCPTFPRDPTRSTRNREHPRPGAKQARTSLNSSSAMMGRWSPESDTELDMTVDEVYRRTTEYSDTHSIGDQLSLKYRVSKLNLGGGRITSETECDRIGSDVGASDVDSSSGPDDIGPPKSVTNTQSGMAGVSGTAVRTDGCLIIPNKRISTLKPGIKAKQSLRVYKRTRRLIGRQISRISDQAEQDDQIDDDERESDSTDFNAAENDNAWIEQDGSTDSERSSCSRRSHQQQQQTHRRVQPTAPLPNTDAGSRTTTLDHPPVPWTEDYRMTASRVESSVKLPSKASETFPKSLANQPRSLTDTVRCFVWEGENNSKINLTMLDIGYNVIRAVERQGISADYMILASVISLILPLLSAIFHWTNFLPTTALANQTSFTTESKAPMLDPTHLLPIPRWMEQSESLLAVHLCVVLRWGSKLLLIMLGQPINCLYSLYSTQPYVLLQKLQYAIRGQWLLDLFALTDLPGRLVVILGVLLRINVYGAILFLLCIAEMTFQQRLLYAKYFFSLTSARRARKYHVPQFRLNKLGHIKCWLTLRSYLKKRGPQRSVETVIAAAFYIVFFFGLSLCSQLISRKQGGVFSHLTNWDILGLTMAIILFLHRLIILGTKITKKYRNFSVLITEQINLYLSMEKKPQKKEELTATFQVLRLVEGLLKEVDGPFRVCGWTVNPVVYNIFKLVLLSCFSSLLSEMLGFKLKLYKLKLNAANW